MFTDVEEINYMNRIGVFCTEKQPVQRGVLLALDSIMINGLFPLHLGSHFRPIILGIIELRAVFAICSILLPFGIKKYPSVSES